MKKFNSFLVLLCFILTISPNYFGQVTVINKFNNKSVPTIGFQQPDLTNLHQEDIQREKDGQFYRIGFGTETFITPENSGVWSTNLNGDRIWRLKVQFPGAEALTFMFSKFHLFGYATMNVYGEKGKKLHAEFTTNDVLSHGQQNLELCRGDLMMLELVEPAGTPKSVIEIDQIMYVYRSSGYQNNESKINESENCQVNVNCSPEGNDWQNEKRGVARILLLSGGQYGYCTGSLINNLEQDCTPYFLTAMHCGEGASTSDLNQWKFYFNYEAPNCTNPSSAGTLDDDIITGCFKIAASEDVNGNQISESDFYLVKLGNSTNQATTINTLKSFNAYWNGWDANNTASPEGVSIHHPAGDIKKISHYDSNLSSTTYSGVNPNTHWLVNWVATTNGHGVTEGGSSGSPIFNYNSGNSRIVGTLSGGSSFCSSPNSPDLYGKMSYHWTSCGTSNVERLKPWLDPNNTGTLVMNGSSDPCASASGAPITDFVANQTNILVGNTVNFTDLSSGTPTTWAWSVSPAAGWSYAGGTNASTQNPQITFNATGQYSITLTATNANGSDSETKTNYIVVNDPSTTPCTAISTNCDEFIANVELNTINNSSSCDNYTDYSSISTTLTKGQAYSINIIPQIVGENLGTAYTDDQVAAWIDYNNDMDFDDAGEQIGMGTVGSGFTGTFNFTVPTSATTATVHMRVRIFYPESGTPNILPCGVTEYGEVEDYRIILQDGSTGSAPTANFVANQTNLTEGTTVNFTDLSSSSPSAWTWTVSPATGWVYAGGTNANSQNPKITFNNVGSYTISLTATNANGSDNETKPSYIIVTANSNSIEMIAKNDVQLFPNPASDFVTLKLDKLYHEATIEIQDVTGKIVAESTAIKSTITKVNLSPLATGIYHVVIKTEVGNVVKKIIKK